MLNFRRDKNENALRVFNLKSVVCLGRTDHNLTLSAR